jgi:hypothetical protein
VGVESRGRAAAFDWMPTLAGHQDATSILGTGGALPQAHYHRPGILNWALVASFADISVWILNPDELHQVDASLDEAPHGCL